MAAGRRAASPLGIGTSSNVIVERWNGIPFESPLREGARRRCATCGRRWRARRSTAEFRLRRACRLGRPEPVPILVAALRSGMLRLAGREGDGAIINWLSADDVAVVAPIVRRRGRRRSARARRSAPASSWRPSTTPTPCGAWAASPSPPTSPCRCTPSSTGWLGRGDRLGGMWTPGQAGDRKAALAAIPDSVVDELIVWGLPEKCHETLRSATSTTASPRPALAPLPFGARRAPTPSAPWPPGRPVRRVGGGGGGRPGGVAAVGRGRRPVPALPSPGRRPAGRPSPSTAPPRRPTPRPTWPCRSRWAAGHHPGRGHLRLDGAAGAAAVGPQRQRVRPRPVGHRRPRHRRGVLRAGPAAELGGGARSRRCSCSRTSPSGVPAGARSTRARGGSTSASPPSTRSARRTGTSPVLHGAWPSGWRSCPTPSTPRSSPGTSPAGTTATSTCTAWSRTPGRRRGRRWSTRPGPVGLDFLADHRLRHRPALGRARRRPAGQPRRADHPGREIITYFGHANAIGETRSVLDYRHGLPGVSLADIQAQDGGRRRPVPGQPPDALPGPGVRQLLPGCEFRLDSIIDWDLVDTYEVLTGPAAVSSSQLGLPDLGVKAPNPFMLTALLEWQGLLRAGIGSRRCRGRTRRASRARRRSDSNT